MNRDPSENLSFHQCHGIYLLVAMPSTENHLIEKIKRKEANSHTQMTGKKRRQIKVGIIMIIIKNKTATPKNHTQKHHIKTDASIGKCVHSTQYTYVLLV